MSQPPPTLFHCPACGAELSVAVAADIEEPPPDIEEPPDTGGPPDVGPPADADNAIRLANRSGRDLVWPFQFARIFAPGEIADTPALLVDDAPVKSQADVLARWPDGSAKHAVLAAVIELEAEATATLSFASVPPGPVEELSIEDMLAFDFDAVLRVEGDGKVAAASARVMLENYDCEVLTRGPVAQTVMLADDIGRGYDIGLRADDCRPLRPRFYATFWPQTGQVTGRVVVEASLTTELADSAYVATLTLGHAAPVETWRLDLAAGQKRHWAMTAWTKRFSIGETVPEVDVDWGLGYLTRVGALPNFDTAIDVTAQLPAKTVGEPYDGTWNGHAIENGMGVAGIREDIGPYHAQQVQALYPKADWRQRELMLQIADQAASFPGHLRESAAKRFAADDPPDSDSGLGRAVSIVARPSLMTTVLEYGYTKPEDRVVFLDGKQPPQPYWRFDGAHQPSYFYIPYLVTGDPWYLHEMYLWAGFSAAFYNGASRGADGRGPTGAEGVINDQLRGAGWVLRNRVETAWIAPDRDPEKAYLVRLAHQALARWEGSLGIAGTVYDGDPVKAWGAQVGNYYSLNNGPLAHQVPPLGGWESAGTPNGQNASIIDNVEKGIFAVRADGAPVAGSFTAPWTQHHANYGLGRAAELGFPAGPLFAAVALWQAGVLLDSGWPKLVGAYQLPVEANACLSGATAMTVPPGGWLSWPQTIAALNPAWLSGDGWDSTTEPSLDQYFAANLSADGRPMWAAAAHAMAVDQALPRAAEAWAWFEEHVYRAAPQEGFRTNARWAVVPRAVLLALPPILPEP